MHICHMDLSLEHVRIYGDPFIMNDNGIVSMNGKIQAKLYDFGFA